MSDMMPAHDSGQGNGMRQAGWLIAAFAALITTGASMADDMADARKELTPSGKMRVGVAVGVTASPLWAVKDPQSGQPRGVTVDLGTALAQRLGVPFDLVVHASSGEVTEALAAGKIEVGFM